MSFIEVMGALALFALFGSSLFIAQQYVFDRLILAECKVIAAIRMQESLVMYQKNIIKELCAEHGDVRASLQKTAKNFSAPAMIITIQALAAQNQSEQNQSDNDKSTRTGLHAFNNVYLIAVQAENPDKKGSDYGTLYALMYVPKVAS